MSTSATVRRLEIEEDIREAEAIVELNEDAQKRAAARAVQLHETGRDPRTAQEKELDHLREGVALSTDFDAARERLSRAQDDLIHLT